MTRPLVSPLKIFKHGKSKLTKAFSWVMPRAIFSYWRALGGFPLVLICVWVGWNFSTNLIFSQSYASIQYRSDDVPFQLVLRRIHDAIVGGDLTAVLSANDYAYGWLFWILNSLLTFPVYLLDATESTVISNNAMEQLVILIPRQLSLVFVTSAIVLWISSFRKLHTRDSKLMWGVIPLMLLIPAVTYAATTFHPTGFQMFLTAFSVHIAVSTVANQKTAAQIRSNFFWSFFLLSLSLWTKVTLLPVFVGISLLLVAVYWLPRRSTGWMILPALTAFFLGFLFSSPLSIIQVFTLQAPSYLGGILFQAGKVTSGNSGWELAAENLFLGVDVLLVSFPVLLSLLFGACFQAWRAWSSGNQVLSLFLAGLVLTICISLMYFSFAVAMGPAYVAIYSSAVIAPLAFGLFGLVPVGSRNYGLVFMLIAILIAVALPRNLHTDSSSSEAGIMKLNYFQVLESSPKHESRLRSEIEISRAVARASPKAGPLRVLGDHRVPKFWSPFDSGFETIYSYDNLYVWETEINRGDFDFVMLSKDAAWFRQPSANPESDQSFVVELLTLADAKVGELAYNRIFENELVVVLHLER